MKRFLTVFASALSLTLGFAGSASADTCFICKSSSSTNKCDKANYCESASGKDTSDDRKKCREAGCDIGGTASCPSAANVKVCKVASLWDVTVPTQGMTAFFR
jgi:hypothetical protein